MLAALTHNIDFIYIYGYSDWSGGKEICSQKKIRMLKDFKLINNIINYI